jgi:integrase
MARHRIDKQARDILIGLCCYGQSKSEAKRQIEAIRAKEHIIRAKEKAEFGEPRTLLTPKAPPGIYSFSTFNNYLYHCTKFVNWAKQEHGCRTVEQAKPFIKEYIQETMYSDYSASTIKSIHAAVAKLYGLSTELGAKKSIAMNTPERKREDITRSRGQAERDKHFNPEKPKNKEFVEFCKATGLRRSEVLAITAGQIIAYKDIPQFRKDEGKIAKSPTNQYIIIHKNQGKGGRVRYVPILTKSAVDLMKGKPTYEKVWPIPQGQKSIFTKADIHSFRRDYATTLYNLYARPIDQISENQKYKCRGNLAGVVYDKESMRNTSEALGHSRICVIAGHYLH